MTVLKFLLNALHHLLLVFRLSQIINTTTLSNFNWYTPQGSVALISQGSGGRTSDVHLTENSELLQKLLPGDVVLVDRGFTIQETAGLYCAEVKLPPFTGGKTQLSTVEVDAARRLSRVHVHVERVIGLIR